MKEAFKLRLQIKKKQCVPSPLSVILNILDKWIRKKEQNPLRAMNCIKKLLLKSIDVNGFKSLHSLYVK